MTINLKLLLSYDVAVIKWIMLCIKNDMTIHYMKILQEQFKIMMPVTTMQFDLEIMSTLKEIRSYNKQNLTLVIISHMNTHHKLI